MDRKAQDALHAAVQVANDRVNAVLERLNKKLDEDVCPALPAPESKVGTVKVNGTNGSDHGSHEE